MAQATVATRRRLADVMVDRLDREREREGASTSRTLPPPPAQFPASIAWEYLVAAQVRA